MSTASVALRHLHKKCVNSPANFCARDDFLVNESILIYLSTADSVIAMHVLESDSIASVKLRIQTFKGFFVNSQKLVFDGRELARNDSRVRDYGVGDGNLLHLVLRLSDIQAIIVRTVCGKEFEFHVERNRNIGFIKQQVAKKEEHFHDIGSQRLIFDGEELEDHKLVNDLCNHKDTVIHLLFKKSAKVRTRPVEKDFEVSIERSELGENLDPVAEKYDWGVQAGGVPGLDRMQLQRDFIFEPLIVNSKIEFPLVIKELLNMTFDGLDKGYEPMRSSEGSGGAYFMQDSTGQKYVSVFKPLDEEPLAVRNPQGLPVSVDGEGLKRGTRVGEGALREVAAFILDHPKSGCRSVYHDEKGFAGVPPTVMVKCLHKGFHYPEGFECASRNIKVGSLQKYMPNNGSCEDMGPHAFPVNEVHKISVLDMRLANADRHAGNILFYKDGDDGQIVLIPIDHGYCLPENFEDCTFEWLFWPQARQPYSKETINYITYLDAEEDIELLEFHGWNMSPECARNFRISTMLLKKGAARGLTPFAIGSLMCRETLKKKSVIELIVQEAQGMVLPGTSESGFLETVSSIMDRHLDQISTGNL